jgi:hypothetical protein
MAQIFLSPFTPAPAEGVSIISLTWILKVMDYQTVSLGIEDGRWKIEERNLKLNQMQSIPLHDIIIAAPRPWQSRLP